MISVFSERMILQYPRVTVFYRNSVILSEISQAFLAKRLIVDGNSKSSDRVGDLRDLKFPVLCKQQAALTQTLL